MFSIKQPANNKLSIWKLFNGACTDPFLYPAIQHEIFILGQQNKKIMLPSSGKFEILGRSVEFFLDFFYCIVHEFKLITKCTSFVNQSTMTQSKENIQ